MATAIGIGQLTLASSRGSSISTTVHRHRVSRTSNRPRGDQSSVPDYYCVGPSMAADWGNDGPPLSRALVQRVFCYFVPYWRRALIALGCIGISAGVGLAPALVTKGVIDYLGNPTNGVGPLALLVAGGRYRVPCRPSGRGLTDLPADLDQPGNHVRSARAALRPAAEAVRRLLHQPALRGSAFAHEQ